MKQIATTRLLAIELRFHELIRKRAGTLVADHSIELPKLERLLTSDQERAWLAIPGMYGGFAYWLEGDGEEAVLIAESWCRVVDGSGQRHRITADEAVLVDEGFV